MIHWWDEHLITQWGWSQWHRATPGDALITRCGLPYTEAMLTTRHPDIALESQICPTCEPERGRGKADTP